MFVFHCENFPNVVAIIWQLMLTFPQMLRAVLFDQNHLNKDNSRSEPDMTCANLIAIFTKPNAHDPKELLSEHICMVFIFFPVLLIYKHFLKEN